MRIASRLCAEVLTGTGSRMSFSDVQSSAFVCSVN